MLPRVDEVTCEQVAREFDDRGPGVCVAQISGEMQRDNPEILDMALRCARDVGKPEEVMVGMCMFYSLLLTQGLRLPKGPPATGSGSLQFSLPHVRAHTRDVIVVQIREPGSCDFTSYDPAVSLQRGAYSRFLSLAGALRVDTPCAGAGHG